MIRYAKPSIHHDDLTALDIQTESCDIGPGKKVEEFEWALQERLGAKHVTVVDSCTSALYLSFRTLKSSRVTLPIMTYAAVPQAALSAGKEDIVFVDHDAPADVTLLYGGEPPKEPLGKIVDAAHAFPHYTKGPIWCYSFGPIKNLTCGQGGAIATDNSAVAERVREWRNLGMKDGQVWAKGCLRHTMPDINAALGLAQLERFNEMQTRRWEIASIYNERLRVRKPEPTPGHSWHLYVVHVPRRDHVRETLRAAGIETQVHYPLLTDSPAFWDFPRAEHPNATAWSRSCLSLPMHPDLSDDDVNLVCDTLEKAL